ncbi:MAG TPA: hypothetical protein VIC27_05850, partial [Ktedonobacterales bacterium]
MNGDDRWATHRPHERRPAVPSEVGDVGDSADLADVAGGAAQARAVARRRGPPAPLALARLRTLGEVTRAVGVALGMTADEQAASEAFDRLERVASLTVEQVAALDDAEARRWFELLGDDLELDLTLEGLDATLDSVSAELRAADDPAGALVGFQRAALAVAETQGDSVSVSARLSVGKRQAQGLAEQALRERGVEQAGSATAPSAPEAALVFYSAAACERLLTLRVAPDWGRRGLGGGEARLCVVICAGAGYLAGPALEVIGAAR